jgi:hypothetical protein
VNGARPQTVLGRVAMRIALGKYRLSSALLDFEGEI